MALVATTQFTITDSNDARPLTGSIQITPGPQQAISKDDDASVYTPDWSAGTGLEITARVYVSNTGAAIDVTGVMSNRRWSTDLATAITGTGAAISSNAQLATAFIGTGTYTVQHNSGQPSKLFIDANMLETATQITLYFDGDYTDPATSLISRVVLPPVTLSLVKTGTNAVFILMRGTNVIQESSGEVKNVAVMTADLMRASGVDSTGITYRWFENNGATQITNLAAFNTKYGMLTTAPLDPPVGTLAAIGGNLPATGAWNNRNTLVIHEDAVADQGTYRVEAKDAAGTVYQTYFTVYDVTDPYQVNIISSTGDKLRNGDGSSVLTPQVFNGSNLISPLTGWGFTWTIYDKDGNRSAFIDTTRTAQAEGRNINSHTTGNSAVFTYSGSPIVFANNDLIKVVAEDGTIRLFEVASGTGNTVTIRRPTTLHTWVTSAAPTASQFVNGKLFVCTGNQGQRITSGATGITVTGYEIDIKATFTLDAERP